MKEQLYNVFNNTDGIFANAEPMNESKADQFIKDFPSRYKAQGYYRTNTWDKIDPNDVELIKKKAHV